MATPNYQYEKRQKDLAKKKKQEEKRMKKATRTDDKPGGGQDAPDQPPAGQPEK